MTIREILHTTDHRTDSYPETAWRYYQEWNNALFLHWKADINELKGFVPDDLEIDLLDGSSWVSLVAFTMQNIRPRYLPAFPPISDFDEINIRTYVKFGGKSGVYFLSIEGGNRLSCRVAKGLSDLPYRFSTIKRTPGIYSSVNKIFGDNLHLQYRQGKAIPLKDRLDQWLTERYALFQDTEKDINQYEIHHLEWPVRELELEQCALHYPRFSGLLKGTPDKTHYSPGVRVLAWGKVRNRKSGIQPD